MVKNLSTQAIAVVFAVFINLLDAVTFGTCFFPLVFGATSSLAIDSFLFSTVAIQVVLMIMSSFQCGLGTSMAENIPFIHTMAMGVFYSMEDTHTPTEMMPTVLATVCVSTVLNGLAFFFVGYFKLGYILHYFPRHVILGMIFGFGIFLLSTAFQVSTGIVPDSNILQNMLAMGVSNWIQLSLVCTLELCLRLAPLLNLGETAGPIAMFLIPIVFYVFLVVWGISFDEAREANWLFPVPPASHGWDMWGYFLGESVHWEVVLQQYPTILSLTAFTLLLVPIRIPTLAMITGDEVDFDLELKAQGVGNIVSGLCGSVHNYLSYSNSVFFYNIGGRGKTAQGVIAAATFALFIIGPTIINYVPRLIAGVIMLHLGFDLVNDAVIASRRALDVLEYSSVVTVGAIVTGFGFVPGIIAGGVSACVTFVVQSSRDSNVRGVFTGDVVRSNTAWSGKLRSKLDYGLAITGVYVIQLQGHIFFGNIQKVCQRIEKIIDMANQQSAGGVAQHGRNRSMSYVPISQDDSPRPPPEYVVLDCSFVSGLDGNAVDGFLKLQRKLQNADFSPDPVHITFAGLQQSLQTMFDNRIAELDENNSDNLSQQCINETTELCQRSGSKQYGSIVSTEYDEVGGAAVQGWDKGLCPGEWSFEPLEHTPVRVKCRTTSRDKIERAKLQQARASRARSESKVNCAQASASFHLDVNTALQSVEELIIESVSKSRNHEKNSGEIALRRHAELHKNPKLGSSATSQSIAFQSSTGFHMLHPHDSFHRMYEDDTSVIDDESRAGRSRNGSAYSEFDTEIPRSVQELQNKKKRLSYDGADLDPDQSMGFHFLSPVKDTSQLHMCFSPPELRSSTLPLEIGLGVGAGTVTRRAKSSPDGQTPRTTLSNIAGSIISSTPVDIEMPIHHVASEEAADAQLVTTNEFLDDSGDVDDALKKKAPRKLTVSPVPEVEVEMEGDEGERESESTSRRESITTVASSCRKRTRGDELKKLIRQLVFELDVSWTPADYPVLKRLADTFRADIRTVEANEVLWSANEKASHMALLITGRLKAVIQTSNHTERRTLQVILPGSLVGELGMLCGGNHSRTIVSSCVSEIAVISREQLDRIKEGDMVLYCTLQKLALNTAASRSQELMLFNAGALGSI